MFFPAPKAIKMDHIIISLLAISLFSYASGSLENRLQYYETLHVDDITHHSVAKRSTSSLNEVFKQQKIVSFSAFDRTFKLHLKRQRALLSKDFVASLVHGNKTAQQLVIDPEDFLEGFVQEEGRSSKVRAYFEGRDLVATIWTRDDVYSVEPSWRHLPHSSQYSMIAYRASDVIKDRQEHPEEHAGASFCGFVHPDHDDAAFEPPTTADDASTTNKTPGSGRNRRQVDAHNTCTTMLVADYKFYDEVGGGNEASTAKYIIAALSRVDALYRATDFGDGYVDVGLEIRGLILHDEPTATSGSELHYNMEKTDWATSELLETFGDHTEWKDYCLVHLFTYTAFSDGVLGLGWIASAAKNAAGGICSPSIKGRQYNAAWTSLSNKYGNRLLTLESDLVTAHEFGHNWGSQHDPDDDECAPGSSSGGKYLMYTYSVSGYEANNDLFSPCSKRSIKAVLASKAANCFTEKSTSFCGNLQVEDGEECDAGTASTTGTDPCCDQDCQFIGSAVCSDANSLCCQNCEVAPATYVCSAVANNSVSCTGDAICNGVDIDCPAAQNRDNGTECIDNGECYKGECLPFCEAKGLVSCICDDEDDSCKFCCEDSNGDCVVYGSAAGLDPVDLPDGKSCLSGACEAGECKKEIRSLSNRLWNVIANLSFNAILEFFLHNQVLAVILLSLIIYVPLCIIVGCIDKKRIKKDKEEVAWRNKDNEELVADKDNKLIRPTRPRKRIKPALEASKASISGVNPHFNPHIGHITHFK